MLPWRGLPCIHCMNTLTHPLPLARSLTRFTHWVNSHVIPGQEQNPSCDGNWCGRINCVYIVTHVKGDVICAGGLLLISTIGQQPWIHLPETRSIYNPPPLSSNEAPQQLNGKSKCCTLISYNFLGRWSVFRATTGLALSLRRRFNQWNSWMRFLIMESKAFISTHWH